MFILFLHSSLKVL